VFEKYFPISSVIFSRFIFPPDPLKLISLQLRLHKVVSQIRNNIAVLQNKIKGISEGIKAKT